MAFKSYHNEEAFEKKAIEYIIDGTITGEMVLKKWARVEADNRDWIWGKVESALAKKDGITKEQQDRLAEIKSAIGR
jgi:acetyl-CoA acetyltransferase